MTDIWFYHLDGQPIERVLASLLEKSLARGWKAVVQAATPERVEAIDLGLWTYDDASFLAHGTARDGDAELQPIYLTLDADNPNAAAIRFFVEGVEVDPVLATAAPPYERAVLLFDGRNDDEVAGARRQWSALKAAGHVVSYWQQREDGRWEKRG